MKSLLILCTILLVILAAYTSASTSPENEHKCNENYANDPVQKFVCTHCGDELPKMRDDLIDRKNQGEDTFERHFNAWGDGMNWHWNRGAP